MTLVGPIFMALIMGLVMYKFSAWNTARSLDAQSTLLVDPSFDAALKRLAEALDVPQVKVHIYEIDPVNGLAAPDGRIFITRGFYQKYRKGEVTGPELASVIAHELGHVALGHSRKRMIDFSGQNALPVALGLVLSRIIPGVGVILANGLATLLMAGLSRNDEYEADAYASAVMIKAGFGTEPQKSLFQKLEALTGQSNTMPAWMMSHPKTSERIAAIEANEQKWGV